MNLVPSASLVYNPVSLAAATNLNSSSKMCLKLQPSVRKDLKKLGGLLSEDKMRPGGGQVRSTFAGQIEVPLQSGWSPVRSSKILGKQVSHSRNPGG